MIAGEYDAGQAYQSFASQLLAEESASEDIVLDSQKCLFQSFFIAVGGMQPILLWQTLCVVFMGRMC